MAKIYVALINKGLRTIEQVPATWRDEVKDMLNIV